MLISPDDVDDRTIPLPAAYAAMIEIDEGGLLVDEEAGRGYALNATATLIWKLFDLKCPVGDLVDEVSAAYGVPRAEVADSVHGMVRAFGEYGLFENVTRNLASIPIDIEYVDVDECGEVIPPPADAPSFDTRYLAAPPNA
ncbi:MAG TPA: PqqD family protein [Acidimicrobiia bacterium]|nr:PqqD family protein [Acidimicrobiia bacterium]